MLGVWFWRTTKRGHRKATSTSAITVRGMGKGCKQASLTNSSSFQIFGFFFLFWSVSQAVKMENKNAEQRQLLLCS